MTNLHNYPIFLHTGLIISRVTYGAGLVITCLAIVDGFNRFRKGNVLGLAEIAVGSLFFNQTAEGIDIMERTATAVRCRLSGFRDPMLGSPKR